MGEEGGLINKSAVISDSVTHRATEKPILIPLSHIQ